MLIFSALQPILYKAVFHGGVRSMWSSVMEVSVKLKRNAGQVDNNLNCSGRSCEKDGSMYHKS